MTALLKFGASACLALGFALASCKTEPTEKAVASGAPSAASALPSAEPPKPWYVGTWSGDYSAQLFKVESGPGAVKDWSKDDGSKASGPGKLTLRIDDGGAIDGDSEGALGALTARGQVDGETLRIALQPKDSSSAQTDAQSFSGTLLGSRSGDAVRGRLQASSGDSLTVREASIELKKQSP